MATVFMKWLETSPKDYDRGIQILTLGRSKRIKQDIVNQYIQPGLHVLEIGCGTGTLTSMMAEKGAYVTAIDASPRMLAEAQANIPAERLEKHVSLKYMHATLIGESFPPGSFDLIVSTLVFSELSLEEQRFILDACLSLLTPEGRLIIADEVLPDGLLTRTLYTLIRLPLVLLTWLLTRTSTRALRNFIDELNQSGYFPWEVESYLGGSLVLYEAVPREQVEIVPSLLKHPQILPQTSLKILFIDLWELFFRIIPPYPKVKPGLYRVGEPDPKSPVLVTGNFELTVRRLVRAIHQKVDVWLLVADSGGINVWCAAGGGYFTSENVIAAVKSTYLDSIVDHHALILPQLCANGVDGWRIRQEIGWGVHWGPVRALDIPTYLASERVKTNAMRWVRFPLKDRLEMGTVTLGFYALLILIPVFFFWRGLFWPITLSLIGLSYFYAIVHPWLPGKDGLVKSISLTITTILGLMLYTTLWGPMPAKSLFNWTLGLIALAVFTAGEMQGMSPLMRGEQANWGWEALMGVTLGLVYLVVHLVVSWR